MIKTSLDARCLPAAAGAGLALIVIVAGCGVLDGKPKNIGAFCAEYAKLECAPTAAICSRMQAECEPIRKEACEDFVTPLMNGAGRLYRADNAEDCLEQVELTYKKTLITPADLGAMRDKCERVVEGSGAANGTCTVDQDCRTPLVCDRGRCGPVRVVAAGGNCANPGERCQPTEFCRAEGGLSVCGARADKGAACSATAPCKPTLRCATTCVDKAAIAAACSNDEECLSGYCNPYPPAAGGRTCLNGLSFSPFSPSCEAFFGPSPTPADGGARD